MYPLYGTEKRRPDDISQNSFDLTFRGHEAIVKEKSNESPLLYIADLPQDRNKIGIRISPEERDLLKRLSSSGAVDMTEKDHKPFRALSYTIELGMQDAPNYLSIRKESREDNIGLLYSELPCLGDYLQLLRIRTYKYTDSSVEQNDAVTDMAASLIQLIKHIRRSITDEYEDVLKQYAYDPSEQLLACGLAAIHNCMQRYDISLGKPFQNYFGVVANRKMLKELFENRGSAYVPHNYGKPRTNSAFQLNATRVLYPQRLDLYRGDSGELLQDLTRIPVDEYVNRKLTIDRVRAILRDNIVPEELLRILYEYYWLEQGMPEIADANDTSKQTISNRLQKARNLVLAALRHQLGVTIGYDDLV